MNDIVNHPLHYTAGKVECIDALEAATVDLKGIEAVCTANAIKYLWRWNQKNGVEDLKKARWYLDHLIKNVDGDVTALRIPAESQAYGNDCPLGRCDP